MKKLELPTYRKNAIYFYKIFSESKAIQVCIANGSESIGITYTAVELETAPFVSNEEEFYSQFHQVSKMLKDIAEVL